MFVVIKDGEGYIAGVAGNVTQEQANRAADDVKAAVHAAKGDMEAATMSLGLTDSSANCASVLGQNVRGRGVT